MIDLKRLRKEKGITQKELAQLLSCGQSFIAAKQLFNAPTTFGFRLRASDLYPPIPYTEITVTKGIADLARFARSKGINLAILKNMNPWLRETSLSNHSGRTYVIKIPTKEGMTYDPKKTVAHDKRWVIE